MRIGAVPQAGKSGLSPKTVKNIHGVLHKALQQAVAIGYLRFNPADACTLPRVERKELQPLDEGAIGKFLSAIKGHPYENLFLVTLFTGMRQGEVLGLTWDCVDFNQGTILINKRLQKTRGGKSSYYLASTKSGKSRKLSPAASVIELLRQQWKQQAEWRLTTGPTWQESGFVFTDEMGGHLMHHTVYHNFKKVVTSIGCSETRFHDLRRGRYPSWRRHQNGAGQLGPRHSQLYAGCLRPLDRPDKTGKCQPNGGLH